MTSKNCQTQYLHPVAIVRRRICPRSSCQTQMSFRALVTGHWSRSPKNYTNNHYPL